MTGEHESIIELRLAYRRDAGESVTSRLSHESSVLVRLLRARFSPRHTRLHVALTGPETTLRRTIGEFLGRHVALRVLACQGCSDCAVTTRA